MSREEAIARIERYFDDGGFFDDLARRVAFRTEARSRTAGRSFAAISTRR